MTVLYIVKNKIFVGKEDEPQVESTTIFMDGVVYDYLEKPAETIVFDQPRGRFILLDQSRRTKTELSANEVLAFIRGLKRRAATADNPFIRFLASPQFDQQCDESSGELTFSSPWMTYRVVPIDIGPIDIPPIDAQTSGIASQYRQFCDWQLRLNTLLRPGSRLPFARMIVNAELEKRDRFPSQVHLTLTPKKGFPPKRFVLRSEHQLIRRLVESDRRRVAQTGEFMAIFKALSFEQYQESPDER